MNAVGLKRGTSAGILVPGFLLLTAVSCDMFLDSFKRSNLHLSAGHVARNLVLQVAMSLEY